MKKNLKSTKRKTVMSIFHCILTLFFYLYPQGDQQAKNNNLSWMKVQMYYHRFNNLGGLLNGDLAAKIGQVILSVDLMDRECNFSIPSKVNSECVYEGKIRKNV